MQCDRPFRVYTHVYIHIIRIPGALDPTFSAACLTHIEQTTGYLIQQLWNPINDVTIFFWFASFKLSVFGCTVKKLGQWRKELMCFILR
jgi:hypothetical protein